MINFSPSQAHLLAFSPSRVNENRTHGDVFAEFTAKLDA